MHHGRVVKRTGDGSLIEFRSVVDAVRCAIEVQSGMVERNAGLPPERRIEFRVGIHLGDVVEESDGDLMGDGVNIAARLEGIAKPGAICLSEDAYRQVSGRLDMEVTDLGQTELKNIERSIRVYSLQVGVPAQAKPVTEAKPPEKLPEPKRRSSFALARGRHRRPSPSGRRRRVVCSRGRAAKPAQAAHLSIVVLPFTNLSNDPAQDYFADGVTENLTTDLSRIRDSFVIARNTAFTFKGKDLDAKEIGKELGVRYVLEGSVQRDGTRVRVNAQLIDAQSGAHLWADRFEEDASDLFKLQDQVVARLANSLGYELVKAEAEKGGHSKNPDAIDLAMRGQALLQQTTPTKDNNDAARALFERALAIDPNYAAALAGNAYTYMVDYTNGWTNPQTDYDAKILAQADRAIALAPDTSVAVFREKHVPVPFAPRERSAQRRRCCSRRQSKFRPSLLGARRRRNFPRPLRTSKVRFTASDAIESSRSENRYLAYAGRQCGARRGTLRRFDRRTTQGARRRLSSLRTLRSPRRRLCARRQDGRGEVRLGGSPPPQSRSHLKWVNRPFAERAEGVRRHAQGGDAGGMKQV